MGVVKLSVMGWVDRPELCSCLTVVTRGLKMCYTKRGVMCVTSVTIQAVWPYYMGRQGMQKALSHGEGQMEAGEAEASLFLVWCVCARVCICVLTIWKPGDHLRCRSQACHLPWFLSQVLSVA